MTNLADADLHGPAVGAPAWPSPDSGAPHTELPPPPAPAASTAIDMPAPLVLDSATDTPRRPPTAATTELRATAVSTIASFTPRPLAASKPEPVLPVSEPSIPAEPTVPTGSTPAADEPGPDSDFDTAPIADIPVTEVTDPTPIAEPRPVAEPVQEFVPEITTATEPAPAILTGPSAILAPDTAVAPIDNAAITLPPVAAKPSAPKPVASIESFLAPDPDDARPRTTKKSGGGRLAKLLVAALVVGGLGYAGATYGPGLYDEYIADEEPAEPAAPLAFPRARTTAPEVRTATFVLEGLTTGSEASYTVTVDFDTHVSRVVIDRTDAPDLEVLTFSDDALVRRLDSNSWFQIERGAFPLDDQLQRTDWVRMIDELVPPERRAGVVIDDSTIATVAGIETRHLVLTLDPALLELVDETGAALDPIQDIADAAASAETAAASAVTDDPNGDVTGDPAAAEAAVAPAGDAVDASAASTDVTTTIAAGPDIETVPVAGEPLSPDAVQVELWIDRQGVVRRSVGADVLGANSITILETTTEAWIPDYPDAAQVQPMTAAALIELGL
jgi:hypothetical protein